MFIDDVLVFLDGRASRNLSASLLPLAEESANLIRSSTAYILTKDAEMARREMLPAIANTDTLCSLFKLPSTRMWIELPEIEGSKKLGIFLERRGENHYAVMAFINAPDAGATLCWLGLFSPADFTFNLPEYQCVVTPDLRIETKAKDLGIDIYSIGVQAAFIAVSTVIFLNSNRISIVRDGNDISRLNMARKRRGKLPLMEYKVLDILPAIKSSMSLVAGDNKNRLHWRRGHFKARKTGMFWWNPHMAGNKELGMIEKDYRVPATNALLINLKA